MLFFPVTAYAFGQTREEKGKKVIDQVLENLGGSAFLNMKDRTEHGRVYSFYNERLSGLSKAVIYTRYLTRPEPPTVGFIGQRERQAFGKKEDYYLLFNETGAYDVTYRGAKIMRDDLIKRYRESLLHNVLYTLRMRIGEPGLVFDYRSADLLDNEPVDIVDIVDGNNEATTVYFHQSQRVPMRQEWTRRDPISRAPQTESTVFSKFRETNGVKWPWVTRRERNGERFFELFVEEMSINAGLTDEFFTIPANTPVVQEQDRKPVFPSKKP